MENTGDLFNKVGAIKGKFHVRMGMVKDINGKDLTEEEEIKKRWQEYTEEVYKKILISQITTMLSKDHLTLHSKMILVLVK